MGATLVVFTAGFYGLSPDQIYCESLNDYNTSEILESMLQETEDDHTHWLEKQLGLIDRIGLEN